jgi:hypothetical protein
MTVLVDTPALSSVGGIESARTIVLARVDDQINWYDRKSGINKLSYKTLKLLQILMTGAIPLASIFLTDVAATRCSALLGTLAVVSEGMLQLWRFHENWVNFRTTSESLKHEKFLFLAKAGPYMPQSSDSAASSDINVRKLAERVESLISRECAVWVDSQKDKDHAATPGATATA